MFASFSCLENKTRVKKETKKISKDLNRKRISNISSFTSCTDSKTVQGEYNRIEKNRIYFTI